MINIGVIGGFWLTDEFIKAIKMTKGARYVAQYSRDIKKAEAYGKERGAFLFYDDLINMANDERIDAVYIASPNMLHYAQSKLMLDAGKHVICEKPVCVTHSEYNELCCLAKEKNVIYMEAMLNTHIEWAKKLKKAINEGGKVICAKLDFCQKSSKLERVEKGMMFSSFDKECCGGALMDLGVYATSLSTYLFGMPKSIFANGQFSENGADLSDTAVLSYEGFDCVISLSKLCESAARSEILCKNSTITMGNISQLQMLKVNNGQETRMLHGRNSFAKSMKDELSDFLSYIAGDKKSNEENSKLTAMSIKLLEQIREKIGYDIKSVKL